MENEIDFTIPRSKKKSETIKKWESFSNRNFDNIVGQLYLIIMKYLVFFDTYEKKDYFKKEYESIKKTGLKFVTDQHMALDRALYRYICVELVEYENQESREWEKTLKTLSSISEKIASIPKIQSEILAEELKGSGLSCLDDIMLGPIARSFEIAQHRTRRSRKRGRPVTAASVLALELFERLGASWGREFKRVFDVWPPEKEFRDNPTSSIKPEFLNIDIALIHALVRSVDSDVSLRTIKNALKDRLPKKRSEKSSA